MWRRVPMFALVATLTACSGSKSTPTEPTPTPTPQSLPATPTNVRVEQIDPFERQGIVSWDGSGGVERYVVEYGSLAGAGRQRVEVAGNTTTATITNLVVGEQSVVVVRAQNSAGASAFSDASSAQSAYNMPDVRDLIEALFFGTGPFGSGFFFGPADSFVTLSGRDSAHLAAGRMLGWRNGTVRVRPSRTLTAEQLEHMRAAVDQLSEDMQGAVRGQVSDIGDVREEYVLQEIAVLVVANPQSRCGQPSGGCASMSRRPGTPSEIFETGILYVDTRGVTVSHEIGHGLVGLHHVTREWPGMTPATMGLQSGRITSIGFAKYERDAVRRVYGAGLRPGASRADFHARDLIRNP